MALGQHVFGSGVMMNDSENFPAQWHLLVGGKPHTVQIMRQVLGILGVRHIDWTADSYAAIELLRTHHYTAVWCDEHALRAGYEDFASAARQTPGILNPMIPIFLVCAGPRRREVEAARDMGFTDVLARPLSAATIMRKLKSSLASPRPFIATGDFFGPDRRSPSRPGFEGKDRRTRKARQVKVAAQPASDRYYV